jgi:L-alanine-DL-glutamate epimerase-like enolase superfamily enzyme
MPQPGPLTLDFAIEEQRLAEPFAITGHVFEAMPALVVRIGDGTHIGRGEAAGIYYLGDDVAHMAEVTQGVRGAIEQGITREALQRLLPPGGARNAIDCALWELEAAQAGEPVWRLAGLPECRPLVTTLTAGADTPARMAERAREFEHTFGPVKALKLKLTGEPDLDAARVEAVRAASPAAWIGVDANQGYQLADLRRVIPAFERCDVKLIEQPLRRGAEDELAGFVSPIPLAADESALSLGDLESLVGRFQVINIKLDKCGGLTEALAMVERARALGFDVMVGNMAGSSWAMGAAFVVGQLCDVVDLDGPISLLNDREPPVRYRDGLVFCDDAVWGRGVPAQAKAGVSG